jgi:hypothetical protein
VRYAGSSLAYTVAGVFAGGLAPLAMTTLYRAYATTTVVTVYATAALALTAVSLLRRWGHSSPSNGDIHHFLAKGDSPQSKTLEDCPLLPAQRGNDECPHFPFFFPIIPAPARSL